MTKNDIEAGNELIVVQQLPVITEKLKSLAAEIDSKIEAALAMECTEATVKTVKGLRAELNKDFKALEERRKEVKSAVTNPYLEFEEVYKTFVTSKFKSADDTLKQNIDAIESDLKLSKTKEVEEYFNEYLTAKKIDFITYETANINVTLTASLTSLKKQAKEFIDKIADDLTLIETQEFKEEILVEYKKTLNVSSSITAVVNRHKAIEEERKRQQELQEQKEKEKAAVKKVDELAPLAQPITPPEKINNVEIIQEKECKVKFTVYDTKTRITKLKEFLEKEGYKYE